MSEEVYNWYMKDISPMQARAVTFWIEGGCKNKAEALRKAGYGKSVIDQPHKVFDSAAVLMELNQRGLDGYGRQKEPEAVLNEPVCEETLHPTPIDFSKASKEWLQDLKERLESVRLPAESPLPIPETEHVPEGHLLNQMVVELEEPERSGDGYSGM